VWEIFVPPRFCPAVFHGSKIFKEPLGEVRFQFDISIEASTVRLQAAPRHTVAPLRKARIRSTDQTVDRNSSLPNGIGARPTICPSNASRAHPEGESKNESARETQDAAPRSVRPLPGNGYAGFPATDTPDSMDRLVGTQCPLTARRFQRAGRSAFCACDISAVTTGLCVRTVRPCTSTRRPSISRRATSS